MSNLDGHEPNFDELKAPDSETPPVEFAADLTGELPFEVVGELAEAEMAQQGELPTEGAEEVSAEAAEELPIASVEETPAKQGRKLPLPVEWIAVAAISVIILALVLVQVMDLSTAIYLVSVGFVGFGVWQGRETNTAYTVLLGCALVAILTALYCLWAELGRYQFDLKAKQHASLAPAVRAGLNQG